MQTKNTYEIGPKAYESRRKKNQNINNVFEGSSSTGTTSNTNASNVTNIKDDFLGYGNSITNQVKNPSPRLKDLNKDINTYGNIGLTNNPFANSTKFSSFQTDTSNPSSIFGKDGSRRPNKLREEINSNNLNSGVIGTLGDSYKNARGKHAFDINK
jgi:hypothetical protein